MVQAVMARQPQPLGHELRALALTRPELARHVERAHRPSHRMPQRLQERRQPASQFHLPMRA